MCSDGKGVPGSEDAWAGRNSPGAVRNRKTVLARPTPYRRSNIVEITMSSIEDRNAVLNWKVLTVKRPELSQRSASEAKKSGRGSELLDPHLR